MMRMSDMSKEVHEAKAANKLNSVRSHVQKQHAVDIQKWSERGCEMRNESRVAQCTPVVSQESQSKNDAIEASKSEPKVNVAYCDKDNYGQT